MAWQFINKASATGTNPSVDITGLPQAGDLLVFVYNCNSSTVSADPSGFAVQLSYVGATPHLYVATKISDGTETAISCTCASAGGIAAVMIYRSIASATPDVTGTTANSASVTSKATASITTTVANDLVLSVWGAVGTSVITADAATTSRFNGAGSNTYLTVGDENKVAAGATSARTGTWSGSANASAVGIAFKQVVGTSPGNFLSLLGY